MFVEYKLTSWQANELTSHRSIINSQYLMI